MILASAIAWPAFADDARAERPNIHRSAHATVQVGKASWYGRRNAGRLTASGERFDPRAMTCAHRTLPMGSVIKVTDIATGRTVSLEVNDRGPFVRGRIVDLSQAAAEQLGMDDNGVVLVRIEVLSLASAT
jgi:rare lipoprotein A